MGLHFFIGLYFNCHNKFYFLRLVIIFGNNFQSGRKDLFVIRVFRCRLAKEQFLFGFCNLL
jgi:hypothetical protein